jgi:hypothetical protein
MLSRDDKRFLTYLALGYLAIAETLSWETSKWPACLVVSEYQNANDHPGYQACATLHEGIMEGFHFLWDHATHDNVAAAATVIIAVFTLSLWRSTDKLWTLGSKSSERQLRAYLGFVRHDIHFQRHEFVIVVRNNGQTPAREVTPFFNMQWYVPGTDMPADFAFADYPKNLGSGPVFIIPQQEHPWSFELNWAQFEQFSNGQLGQFYLYGRFEYLDVFGERRESQFCYQAVRFPAGGGAFRAYNRHNDCT